MGAGLAGTFLAAKLSDAGYQVNVLDDPKPNTASRIAAGMFNVVTGRYAAKTWKAELLLEKLYAFFDEERYLPLRPYFHPAKIYRPFKTTYESNEWVAKSTTEKFRNIVGYQATPYKPEQIHNPHGGIWIKSCGWMDCPGLLKAFHVLLKDRPNVNWHEEKLDYDSVNPEKQTISTGLGRHHFNKLIFCEGHEINHNPFFSAFIPVEPLKGQISRIKVQGFEMDHVLSNRIYVCPLGNDEYVLGATYEKTFEVNEPTKAGTIQLKTQLEKAIKLPFTVINESAAIRPTSPNRRPILGAHPEHKDLLVINGMGTKGVLQAPYCAELMTRYIESGEINVIPEEARISRFLE